MRFTVSLLFAALAAALGQSPALAQDAAASGESSEERAASARPAVPLGSRQPAARPNIYLPEEPVRSIVLNNCISCHGITEWGFNAMDRAGWKNLLDTTHKEQRGVALPNHEEEVLLDFFVANFGPESIPFPRNYFPPTISEFLDDDGGRAILDLACRECHEIRVYEKRLDLEDWRSLIVDMRERGALIDPYEVEQLAEWLSRVQGINPLD